MPFILGDDGALRGLGLHLDSKKPQSELEAEPDTDPSRVRARGVEGVWEGFPDKEVLELSSEAQMWGPAVWPMVTRSWILPLKSPEEP